MSQEGKRAVIAVIRRIIFAGIILLTIWLILIGLRGTIPAGVIDHINAEGAQAKITVSYDSSTWDWTKSFWRDETVSETIGQYKDATLSIIALSGLLSLMIAGILLFIGVIISRIMNSPGWLARVRSILRLVLVSGGASIPIFIFSSSVITFTNIHIGWSPPPASGGPAYQWIFYCSFCCSLLPAWLLVQTGNGILSNRAENIPNLKLIWHVGISLLIRVLKLVGAIIVISIIAEQTLVQPGLGRLLMQGVNRRDFPIIFGVVWFFVIIVVLVKLVAELIEIAYNHFSKTISLPEQVQEERSLRFTIPKGWLIFSLVLVVLIILIAVVAPLLAPYGMNEIHLMDRLREPSSKYLLGTDQLGRDILSRLLYGIRIDVLIGFISAIALSIVATGWVIPAAYFRRMNTWIGDTLEDMVMLPRDIICAVPWLVLLLLLISMIVKSSISWIALISGLVMLPHAVGIIQEAYRSPPEGKGWLDIVLHAIPVVLIFATAGIIFYVSTLSYTGFWIPPGFPELGSILSSEGRQFMEADPWIAIWPSFCLMLILLILVMTGEALLERSGFRSKAVWSKTME
jgi:peptide/nickel transport system permease protein